MGSSPTGRSRINMYDPIKSEQKRLELVHYLADRHNFLSNLDNMIAANDMKFSCSTPCWQIYGEERKLMIILMERRNEREANNS